MCWRFFCARFIDISCIWRARKLKNINLSNSGMDFYCSTMAYRSCSFGIVHLAFTSAFSLSVLFSSRLLDEYSVYFPSTFIRLLYVIFDTERKITSSLRYIQQLIIFAFESCFAHYISMVLIQFARYDVLFYLPKPLWF